MSDEFNTESLGIYQEVLSINTEPIEERAAYKRALRFNLHFWVMISSFVVENPEDVFSGKIKFVADGHNLISAHFGCYICEEEYSKSLLNKKCSGEPKY